MQKISKSENQEKATTGMQSVQMGEKAENISQEKTMQAKRNYHGKYPRRIRSYSYSQNSGHHIELNDGTAYRIKPILPATESPKPGQDFDTMNGTAFAVISPV